MRFVESFGQFLLGQAGRSAGLHHQFAEGGLPCGMNGFVEFARAGSHWRGRLIRSSDYPKKGYTLTLLLHSLTQPGTSLGKASELPSRWFGGAWRWRRQDSRTKADPAAGFRTLCGIQRPRKPHRARIPQRIVARAVAQGRARSGSIAAGGRQRRI